VYDWFHQDCPHVHLDKDRNVTLKGQYFVTINGKRHKVACQKHVAYKTKEELTQSFFDSNKYQDWKQRNPDQSMGFRTVSRLICPCIAAATVKECVCRLCTEYSYSVKAWDTQRVIWRKEGNPCECPLCSDPELLERCTHTRAHTHTHKHTHFATPL
jgi:hypothetical protein